MCRRMRDGLSRSSRWWYGRENSGESWFAAGMFMRLTPLESPSRSVGWSESERRRIGVENETKDKLSHLQRLLECSNKA